jgi:alpha-L-arabinofuranosidase
MWNLFRRVVLMDIVLATGMPALAGEQQAATPTLEITRDRVCGGSISPYQCGQFIEYLCAMTPSMFAEKVFDGSFEGVPDYKVVFRKELDRLEKPWYADGAMHRGEFTLDPEDAFNGRFSQRIVQKEGCDPSTLGVSQDGKYVKAGETLRLSLYLRAKGTNGPVVVALWGEGKTYATAEFRPTTEWQRFEATLAPTHTDTNATLTISFRGPGAIWIDQVSLMPTDTVFGWRRDAAEALKAIKPGIIRFGGSTIEGFEWTDTIGDPAKRVPFTTCWGGLEPGNAGLDEFLQLCEWAEAEALICVRFSGKTPKDAADQVEYVNGPATSPMGKLRAANGHPKPYGVKYWQIGNELGDETYQKGVAEFCKAMKAVDPTIKLMGAFPSPGLLRNAGQYLDYICPHHYAIEKIEDTENDVVNLAKMIAENAPGRDIRLGITEWNTTAGDFGLGRGKLLTLDNALWCSRYHNLMHRHCDLIEIANRSNFVDSFCSGIVQPNNHGFYLTPTYHAQQLYAQHSGAYPLRVTDGASSEGALDVSATLSAEEDRLAIFVVNPSLETQRRTVDLSAFASASAEAQGWTLADSASAGERDAMNSWREPQRVCVKTTRARIAHGTIAYEFPALSLSVLEIACKKPTR